MQNCIATMATSLAATIKLNTYTPYDPAISLLDINQVRQTPTYTQRPVLKCLQQLCL
jgi:hypothetical protein